MLKSWQSDFDYKVHLKNFKASLSSADRLRWRGLKPIRKRLELLQLDPAIRFLSKRYSEIGRPAVNQPQIIRSFILLFLLFRDGRAPLSLTKWVEMLNGDKLLAALIGSSIGSSPPLGSYYDFMDRLWLAPQSDRYSRNKTFPSNKNKSRPKKPKGKGQKASEKNPAITRMLGDRFIAGKDGHLNFQAFLQEFFFIVAVYPSMKSGLIPNEPITVSGDGTALHTHASPYGKSRGNPDALHWSDPDASWGWDSDLDKYYFGYTIYQLSYYNGTVKTDLPLCLRLLDAKRHDSVNFLLTYQEFKKNTYGLDVKNICLDSAHDNYPTYELLIHDKVRPFIDLNSNRGRPASLPEALTIDKDGTPLCPCGKRMIYDGFCKDRSRMKWRCPAAVGKCEQCQAPCSPSPYGRVIYTKPSWDVRLFTPVPRGTAEYTSIYKKRTCTERINNRILNDYGLHSMIVHTAKRNAFMMTIIGICIHLDARYKQLAMAEQPN